MIRYIIIVNLLIINNSINLLKNLQIFLYNKKVNLILYNFFKS